MHEVDRGEQAVARPSATRYGNFGFVLVTGPRPPGILRLTRP